MAKSATKWVICYIDATKLHLLSVDLRKHEKYRRVEAYIPSVEILRKKLKGKNQFETVPLLFNYGFFKVPKYFIPNPHFLEQMESEIRCLYAWVKDPLSKSTKASLLHYAKGKLYNPMGVALATDKEINAVKEHEKQKAIYTEKDIDTLYEGKIIILQKYPFDNLPAEIMEIDRVKKEVKVKLLIDTFMAAKPIRVAFENIFYSVYQSNYLNLEMKEQSIEAINQKFKNFTGKDHAE